jgi:hypothetical protein
MTAKQKGGQWFSARNDMRTRKKISVTVSAEAHTRLAGLAWRLDASRSEVVDMLIKRSHEIPGLK